MSEVINIVFGFNQEYQKYAFVCANSIILNTNEKVIFHLIYSEENVKINKYWNKLNIKLYPINKDFYKEMERYGRITIDAYNRLFIGDLLSDDINKCIYLDCDTIINGNIKNLNKIDLNGKVCGAVLTNGVEKGIIPGNNMFNSGVLLIDLNKWKEKDIGNKVINLLCSEADKITIGDQEGLNIILVENETCFIAPKWNFTSLFFENLTYKQLGYTQKEYDEAKNNPQIIHFTGDIKPWNILSSNPMKLIYYRYLFKTNIWNFKDFVYYILNCLNLPIVKNRKLLFFIRKMLLGQK